MSNLTLRTQELPDRVLHVVAEGVLDADTSGRLDALISGAISRGWVKLVCDLEKVTYIASAGAGVFIGSVQPCKDKGGGLVLVHRMGSEGAAMEGGALSQGFNPLQIFDLLGIADMIPVAPTLEAARKLLG